MDVEADGLAFDADSIQAERITEDADYEGIRIRFRGTLDSARINMQVDIGFGDVVYPKPEKAELPTMLDSPAPRLLCYSRESSIAEKFETMVKLGVLNSRMKDFYDIWLLSRQFDFDGAKLAEAIRLTFERRGTALPTEIEAFTEPFIDAKQIQWTTFWKRLQQDHVPVSFIHSGKSRLRWMDFSRQLSRPFPPANQVAQTGSHPAHGPEPMDSHQKEHPQSFFIRTARNFSSTLFEKILLRDKILKPA